MEIITLKANKRSLEKKVSELRSEKRIPCIVYGSLTESILVDVDYQEFRKAFKVALFNKIINLDIEGETLKVLVKDFDKDPVRDDFIHIDFYAIAENKKVTVAVPVKFEGDSPAIRIGAVLYIARDNVKVKCLPKDIPGEIIANISTLKEKGDKIRVSSLEFPSNVECLLISSFMLAKAELPRSAKTAAEEAEETKANEEKMAEVVSSSKESKEEDKK